MKICKDEKLAYQRQKERKHLGKELGNFCQQFDNHHRNSFKGKKSKKTITCNGQCDKTMNNRHKTMDNRKNHTYKPTFRKKNLFNKANFLKQTNPQNNLRALDVVNRVISLDIVKLVKELEN